MKPMDLMDAIGDVPDDLINAAVSTQPICEKKRAHIILSRGVALTALAASVAVVFVLIHMIGKFSEQPETVPTAELAATDLAVQTAEKTTASTVHNSTENVTAETDNTANETNIPASTASDTFTQNTETAALDSESTTALYTDGTLKTAVYETTEDPYHSTAKTDAETVPAEITTFTTATFHTVTDTLPYIPPREVEQQEAVCWRDCTPQADESKAKSPFDLHDSITIPALPNFQFTWENEAIAVMKNGTQIALFGGMPMWSAYFTDLTGDGIPELCADMSFGSGMVDEHIIIYDCMEQKEYALWDRCVFDYRLGMENGALTVTRTPYASFAGGTAVSGRIVLQDGIAYFVEKGKQLDTTKPPITEYIEGSVVTWFDKTQSSLDPNKTLRFRISAYPDTVFIYENNMMYFEQNGHKNSIASGTVWNAFFTDLTGDGKPEICITQWLYSALDSVRPLEVMVMDIAGMQTGHLVYYQDDQDGSYRDTDNEYDYVLYVEYGELFVNKNSWLSAWDPFSKHGTKGRMHFEDYKLIFDEVK